MSPLQMIIVQKCSTSVVCLFVFPIHTCLAHAYLSILVLVVNISVYSIIL